jgi:hypothetical protein
MMAVESGLEDCRLESSSIGKAADNAFETVRVHSNKTIHRALILTSVSNEQEKSRAEELEQDSGFRTIPIVDLILPLSGIRDLKLLVGCALQKRSSRLLRHG